MKKLLVLLAMLGTYMSSYAFLTQNNWRWRNNDGNETTATWKAAQNTAITYNSIHEVIRLRIEVFNNETGDPIAVEDSLQYSTTPLDGKSWINITDSVEHAFVMAGANAYITQDQATTSQLTGVAFPFVAGELEVTDSVAKGFSVPSKDRTEVEWAIRGTANTAPNTTYYFRHWGSTSNPLMPGVPYPSLTTGATLPVKLTSFVARSEGKFVRLDWITSSEQSNERFEVERSANGSSWETIASLKGKGTTSTSASYTAYDNKPLLGENYYRLKQFDVNGRYATSAVKLVNIFGTGNAAIMISPNPSNSSISFTFQNKQAAEVLAVLSDANGRILHQQKFKNVSSGTINQLSLNQKPSAGVYYLKIYADGVGQSMKVLVQ
jgi:hypothetical protein